MRGLQERRPVTSLTGPEGRGGGPDADPDRPDAPGATPAAADEPEATPAGGNAGPPELPAGRGWRGLALGAAVAAVVVLLDVVTKSWAVHRLAGGSVHVLGPLDFELSFNTGSSFSLFQGQTGLVVLVASALVVVLATLAWRAPTTARAAVIGLILGGALGNLGDRLVRDRHGAVVDFVALHVWPTFNVADACIVVGCILLVLSLLRTGRTR